MDLSAADAAVVLTEVAAAALEPTSVTKEVGTVKLYPRTQGEVEHGCSAPSRRREETRPRMPRHELEGPWHPSWRVPRSHRQPLDAPTGPVVW